MLVQTGMFNLYRQCPLQKEVLSFSEIDKDKHIFMMCFKNSSDQKAFFNFVNVDGYIAKFLVTDKVYFPVVILRDEQNNEQKWYFYSAGQTDKFFLKQSDQLKDRIFLYFPPGTLDKPATYTFDCNLSGYFFVHGNTLNTSTTAEFNSSLTDLIFLGKKESNRCKKKCPEVLARDCTSNCSGKNCTEDNGCGLPCGCPEGKICLSSGTCADKEDNSRFKPICPETSNCGGQDGFCSGICPKGFKCAQDGRGRFFCKKVKTDSWLKAYTWFIIILIVIAFLIALIIFWCFRKGDTKSCDQNTFIEKEETY